MLEPSKSLSKADAEEMTKKAKKHAICRPAKTDQDNDHYFTEALLATGNVHGNHLEDVETRNYAFGRLGDTQDHEKVSECRMKQFW